MSDHLQQNLDNMTKTAMYELIRDHDLFKNKTWNLFLPYKKKKTGDYIILISEGTSGFALNIVLPKDHIPVMEKAIVKKILIKQLAQIIVAYDKYPDEKKVINHNQKPLTSNNGKLKSFYMKADKIDNNTIINYFGWKGNIICSD